MAQNACCKPCHEHARVLAQQRPALLALPREVGWAHSGVALAQSEHSNLVAGV